jgi:rhodanese-related sulfurtransferase
MKMKIVFIFLAALILVKNQAVAQTTDLTSEEFQKNSSADNVQILDVRTQAEYNSGHIKNAFLVDWTQRDVFEERIKYLDKNKPVYTYCLVGGRSSAAATRLKELGFKEVYNLQGGIKAWKEASKPVEGVVTAKQISMKEFMDTVSSAKTVLVDVGAVWCPPCKQMEPIVSDLAKTSGGKYKLIQIDGGAQEKLAAELKAGSFPTFIIYKNAKEVWRTEGVVSKEELLKQLK